MQSNTKEKIYYTMGEVSEMFDVNPSLLRYWEQEFDILKPSRNNKGNRLFSRRDVETVRIIYHLVRERKMKIEMARDYLKAHREEARFEAELTERLLSIRSMLMEIKYDLLEGGDAVEESDTDALPLTHAHFGEDAAADDLTEDGVTEDGKFGTDTDFGDENFDEDFGTDTDAQTEDYEDTVSAEADTETVAERETEADTDAGADTVGKDADSGSVAARPAFEEQMLFDIAVPMELLRKEEERAVDNGYESARAGFEGRCLDGEQTAEDSPAPESPKNAIEQTLF